MNEDKTGQNKKSTFEKLKLNINKDVDKEWIKCVTCFVLDEQGNVLVEKRASKGLHPGQFDLCSGHLEEKETQTQGMVRELNEELGIDNNVSRGLIKLLDSEKLDFSNTKFAMKVIVSIYALKINSGYNFKIQNEEIENIEWMKIEEFFEMLEQGKTRFPNIGEKYYDIKDKVINLSKNQDLKKEYTRD